MSKRKLTYQDFKKYFSNHLQNKDKHAFEKKMMQDAFEEEAFDGLSQLSQFELGNDIAELKANIDNRTKKTQRLIPGWFKYAASIVVLIGVGLSVIYLNSRYWQDSMLKEQVSEELELADSIILNAEKALAKQDSLYYKKDSNEDLSKEFIAENKDIKQSKTIQQENEIIIVDDEIVIEDADKEMDLNETIVVVEFEDEEEAVVEETYEVKAVENLTLAEERAEIKAKKAKVSTNESITKVAKPMSDKEILSDSNIKGDIKTKVIQGRVLDSEDKLSIPGVTVVFKENPKIGTTTDIDGKFTIRVPNNDEELKTLIASFVGMETTEINISNDSNLIVFMDLSSLEMDEVVVTAIGVRREAKALGYSVASVEEDYIANDSTSVKENIKNYKKFILDNINYSKLSDFPGKYKIKISFIIDINGEIKDISIKNSPNSSFTYELHKVLNEITIETSSSGIKKQEIDIVKFTIKIEIKE